MIQQNDNRSDNLNNLLQSATIHTTSFNEFLYYFSTVNWGWLRSILSFAQKIVIETFFNDLVRETKFPVMFNL